jgi:chromosome segregation protein
MDRGAHFHKCDFQVHTPRDLDWKGERAVTPDERKAYSEELVRSCRTKGIGSVAITDHHDFAFFPYVRKAAQDELDDVGQPIPDAGELTVFPGIELTLTAPPCQALLILDATFPESLLPSVLTALSISAAPASQSKHAPVERIPQGVVSDLGDLYEKLTSHQELKGRFIVLPNVSESGYGTILRSGFGNFYKSMPCVGGYVDGAVSQFGAGNLAIVCGENRDYGFKAIGVFQTSDNRTRSHENLGKYTTWVKWSEPTAEALRQACLAKESRMCQDQPELPALWIASIRVSNSKFMGRIDLELNQQYNAIIGGRGTGKSTILEYLRWGLCDEATEIPDLDIAPIMAKRKKTIDDTLQSFDGEVHTVLMINGVQHIVKRSSKTKETQLKIADEPFQQVSSQEVRNLLPIQAYSQKQLSSVGVRVEELKRFVELPTKKSLDQIRAGIRDTAARLKAAYGGVIRRKEIEAEIKKYGIEQDSLSRQLEALRGGLKGLPSAEQTIMEQRPKYDNEEGEIERLKGRLEVARSWVSTLESAMPAVSSREEGDGQFQNPTLIAEIREAFEAKFAEMELRARGLRDLFAPESLLTVDDKIRRWETLKAEFDEKYRAAKLAANINQKQLDQIQEGEQRLTSLRRTLAANRDALAALGDPDSKYKELRQRWDSSHVEKLKLLDRECQKFSALSNGFIKAEIVKGIDARILKQSLKTALSGTKVRDQKIDDLCQSALKKPDPLAAWNEIVLELEGLALHDTSGPAPPPTTPTMTSCGFIESERVRIANDLTVDKWLELSCTELEFSPKFSYCTNRTTNEYIDFSDASAGQQATALLTVLLNQQGSPLVIDQPEDDVDSKLVRSIIEQVWKAKTKRQLVFTSHNANFVVNGDAELVICCDYVKAGDQTAGKVKYEGAIDNEKIKEEITLVTEGGKEAFNLRRAKYGF